MEIYQARDVTCSQRRHSHDTADSAVFFKLGANNFTLPIILSLSLHRKFSGTDKEIEGTILSERMSGSCLRSKRCN
jgi:hypothetical protein